MRLSIIICVYNYQAYLDQAITSAVQQDVEDLEVIVVDDGSTDGSREVIERWGERVVPVFKENGGQVSAYNAGFARASGDIVLFLDADDYLLPGAASQILKAFSPETVKVHFRLQLVDQAGHPTGGTFPRRLDEGDLRDQLLQSGVLYASAPGSGNAYRRSALMRLMPIAENTVDRHGADLYTIYGVSLLGEIRTVHGPPLAAYRMHSLDQSSLHFGNAAQVSSPEPESSYRRHSHLRSWILERLDREYAIHPRLREFSLEKQGFARAVFEDGNYLAGLQRGVPYLWRRLLPAIGARRSWLERTGLTSWAVAVLLLPRPVSAPLARYVCNPGSRT